MREKSYSLATFITVFLCYILMGFSLLLLMFEMGTERIEPLGTILSVFTGVLAVLNIVLTIVLSKNRKKGDEFTTKILHKASFFVLYFFLLALMVFFLVLMCVISLSYDIDTITNINEVLDVRIVIAGVVIIVDLAILTLMLVTFILGKKGEFNEPKNKTESVEG